MSWVTRMPYQQHAAREQAEEQQLAPTKGLETILIQKRAQAFAHENLGDELYKKGNLAGALRQSNMALSERNEIVAHYVSLEGFLKFNKRVMLESGNIAAAILQEEKLAALQEQLQPDTQSLAACYAKVGWIHYEEGDYEAALVEYRSAVSVQSKLGPSVQLSSMQTTIDMILNQVEKRTMAEVEEAEKEVASKREEEAREQLKRDLFLLEQLGAKAGRNPSSSVMARQLNEAALFAKTLAADSVGAAAVPTITGIRNDGSAGWKQDEELARKPDEVSARIRQDELAWNRQDESASRNRQDESTSRKRQDESSRKVDTSVNEDSFDQLDDEFERLIESYKTSAPKEAFKNNKASTKEQPAAHETTIELDNDNHCDHSEPTSKDASSEHSLFEKYAKALRIGDWGISNTVTHSDGDASGDASDASPTGNNRKRKAPSDASSTGKNRKRKAPSDASPTENNRKRTASNDDCPPARGEAVTTNTNWSFSSFSSKPSISNHDSSSNDESYYPNTGNRWSAEEDAILLEKRASGLAWAEVEKCLPGRSVAACVRRHRSQKLRDARRESWTEAEDAAVLHHKALGRSWESITETVPTKSANECMSRYSLMLKPRKQGQQKKEQKKHEWTEAQDTTLLLGLARGASWREISVMFPGRGETECRNRYHNVLRPRVESEQHSS